MLKHALALAYQHSNMYAQASRLCCELIQDDILAYFGHDQLKLSVEVRLI